MSSKPVRSAQSGPRGRRARAWTVALATAALLAACGGGEEGPPAVKHAVIEAGGRPVEVEMRRFRAPPWFPLPFVTYLPEGVRVELPPSGEGSAVTFVSHLEGERRDDAYVHLYVAPEGTPEPRARALVRDAAERLQLWGDGTELEPARLHPWAVEEYALRSRGTVRDRLGWMALGRRGGRWFLLVVQYPAALAGTFGPRASRVVEEWRWADGTAPRGLTE